MHVSVTISSFVVPHNIQNARSGKVARKSSLIEDFTRVFFI